MNFEKAPRQAVKLAKQQKRLRRIAKQNPNKLQGRERAMADWTIELDNYEDKREEEHDDFRHSGDER